MIVLFTFCLLYLWFCVLPQGVHCLGGSKWRWSQWRRTHRKLKKERKRERVCLYVCLRNDPSVCWRFLLPRNGKTFSRQTKCKKKIKIKKIYMYVCIYKVSGPNSWGPRIVPVQKQTPVVDRCVIGGRGPARCRGLDQPITWSLQKPPSG